MQPEVPSPTRPTRIRWLIFLLACAASWLLYLHRYSWGLIRPAFRADHPELDDVEMGWLDAAFQAAYAIGQVPGGMAGDRFGPRATMSLFVLFWTLSSVGIAWSGGFWRLVTARATFGLAQAGAYPVISKITRIWFHLSSRTTVQGIVAAMGRIGAATAPLIIATLLIGMLELSWQTALWLLTIPGIVLAVAFWLAMRDSPREHPWVNAAERSMLESETPVTSSPIATPPPPALQLTFASLFSLAMLLLYAFASTFQDQFYVNLLPSYLRDGKGFDFARMGLYAPLPLLGGAAGGIVGGILNDFMVQRMNRRWARSLVAFTGKTIAAGMVLVSMQMEDGRIALFVLVAARVFGDWSLPTQWATITDMSGRAAATVFGLVNTVGAVGGFVAGPIFGWLMRDHGWNGVFVGVAAMCFLSALTFLFIDCTKKIVSD